MSEACASCRFYHNAGMGGMIDGRCRRRPPTTHKMPLEHDDDERWSIQTAWPRVDPSDWCGEYLPVPWPSHESGPA